MARKPTQAVQLSLAMPPSTSELEATAAKVLSDHLVVYPGGWDADLPAWLRQAVGEERLERSPAGEDGLATLAEVVCYMFIACMSVPLNHERAGIYCNLAAQYMAARGAILPEDMQPRPFTEYEERLLRKLRSDIRRTQKRERQRRRRKHR